MPVRSSLARTVRMVSPRYAFSSRTNDSAILAVVVGIWPDCEANNSSFTEPQIARAQMINAFIVCLTCILSLGGWYFLVHLRLRLVRLLVCFTLRSYSSV